MRKKSLYPDCPHLVTHNAPVYGTLLRPMLFFFLHKCWQWLIDGKKRKTCKHFLSSWSTEQTQLIQTLCLILSPSCLRFYVFKSSYESLLQEAQTGLAFQIPSRFHFKRVSLYLRSFFKKVLTCASQGQKGRLRHWEQSLVCTSGFPNLWWDLSRPIALQWNSSELVLHSFSQQRAPLWRLQVMNCDCLCHRLLQGTPPTK